MGKEALDAAGYGQPSWRDLTWDVAGTAVGLGLALVVHLGPRARENLVPVANDDVAVMLNRYPFAARVT